MDKVAAIIPSMNEEKAIQDVIREVPDSVCGTPVETFVIDGGSTDNTCDKVKETKGTLINQSYDGGKGSAIREALDNIEADVYVFLDGDKTYSPGEMEKLVKPIIESDYDHVTGSRLSKRDEEAFMYRNLAGNLFYSWFFRLLTASDVNDFLTGYRAISKSLADNLDLESEGFEIETELTFKTLNLGYEIKEVDITYKSRVGESELQFLTDGPKILYYGAKLSLAEQLFIPR